MKKSIILLILIGSTIQSCRKEDDAIDYSKVKSIIINGSYLNDKDV
jgi:hypothetical protein